MAHGDEPSAEPSTTASDEELALRILAALRSPVYQLGREAMIAYETTEGERSSLAILDMRDALDHLVNAAVSGDWSKIPEAEDHLRRAGVEPAQDMTESRLLKINRGIRLYALRKIVFPGLPGKGEVDRRLAEIKRHLMLGRTKKAQMVSAIAAIEHFVAAHAEAVALDEAIHRPALAWWVRATLYLLPIGLGVLVAVLLR